MHICSTISGAEGLAGAIALHVQPFICLTASLMAAVAKKFQQESQRWPSGVSGTLLLGTREDVDRVRLDTPTQSR